jgi:hypothetical protein
MLGSASGKSPVRVGTPEGSDEPSKARNLICDGPARLCGSTEKRHYCFGWVEGGVLTVRFTYREDVIRIFGAGYWRKGKQIYERENQIHRRTSRKPESRS